MVGHLTFAVGVEEVANVAALPFEVLEADQRRVHTQRRTLQASAAPN